MQGIKMYFKDKLLGLDNFMFAVFFLIINFRFYY